MSHLLSTSEAARVLGVSRQHVADLCDRGVLPCVRVGSHRRIPRPALRTLTTGLSERDVRSLRLHAAVAGRLALDPDGVIAHARAFIARTLPTMRADARAAVLLQQWSEVLDRGPEAVLETLTSTSEVAQELRSASPFAGVLSDSVRRRVLAAT